VTLVFERVVDTVKHQTRSLFLFVLTISLLGSGCAKSCNEIGCIDIAQLESPQRRPVQVCVGVAPAQDCAESGSPVVLERAARGSDFEERLKDNKLIVTVDSVVVPVQSRIIAIRPNGTQCPERCRRIVLTPLKIGV
jgi:hypothetical protein